MMADDYRSAWIRARFTGTTQQKFEQALELLFKVDPQVRFKRNTIGTYLVFSDGSVWLLGKVEDH